MGGCVEKYMENNPKEWLPLLKAGVKKVLRAFIIKSVFFILIKRRS